MERGQLCLRFILLAMPRIKGKGNKRENKRKKKKRKRAVMYLSSVTVTQSNSFPWVDISISDEFFRISYLCHSLFLNSH